jgi:type IV pilus assembly protein PilE
MIGNPRLSLAGDRSRGFTIIETLIAVVIIGLLSAIAYPAYQAQVIKGKRAQGRAALVSAATKMEKFFSTNGCYPSSAANCGGVSTSAAALTAIGAQSFSGDTASSSYYNIQVTLTPQAFTLTAIPQVPFVDSVCGNLTLSNLQRRWSQSNGTSDDASVPSACW